MHLVLVIWKAGVYLRVLLCSLPALCLQPSNGEDRPYSHLRMRERAETGQPACGRRPQPQAAPAVSRSLGQLDQPLGLMTLFHSAPVLAQYWERGVC